MRYSRAVKHRVRRRHLFAETLEQRRLLAADFAEVFPALRLDADPHAADHLHSACTHEHHGEQHPFHLSDGQLQEPAAMPSGSAGGSGESLQLTSATLHPLSSIPVLNSFPGASATLYLDFDGHFEAQWGAYSNITTPVYDADGDATTFSDAELTFIQQLWTVVAEDFAPFNINVTTVEPVELAPGAPSSAADGKALRVAIGGKSDWIGSNYGGYAYVGSFTNSIPNVVYVFAGGSTNVIRYSRIASHEAGHAFGLYHKNVPQDIVAGRTIIMASSAILDYEDVTWHSGVNEEGVYQDDMAIIAGPTNGFGYRADDHGDAIADATPLAVSGLGAIATGIISTNNDVDVFSISSAPSGSFLFSLEGVSPGQHLDAVLELRDSTGAVLLTAGPGDSLDASLIAGTPEVAYVVVRSTGEYGRVGQYTLRMTPTSPGVRLVTSKVPLTTSESGRSESITLALSARPTADVTFHVQSSDLTEATVSVSQLTFTPDNWFIPQQVVITGHADGASDGAAGYTVTISPAASADPAYNDLVDPEDVQLVNLDEATGRLYWTSENPQWFAHVNGSSLLGENAHTVVDIDATFPPANRGYFDTENIAIDPVRGQLYWTDRTNGVIYRTNLDGSAPTTLLTGLGGPDGLAIDAVAGKIYWINGSQDTIQRANLNGSGIETLVSQGLGVAANLKLDIAGGKMYWNDTQLRTISRANLDGSNVEVVVPNDGVHRINVFTVDGNAGKVYFQRNIVAQPLKAIYSANLDGTNEQFLFDVNSLLPESGATRDMDIDGRTGRLYWTSGDGYVYSANLDGSLVAVIAESPGAHATGLALMFPTPGVSVSSAGDLVTTEAGGTATFSIVLNAQPSADVTIPVASSDPGEGIVSTSTLVFTPDNWDEPQIVTITGVDELLNDGDVAYSIQLGNIISADADYHGIDVPDVSVTNLDDDEPLFADSFEVGEWNGLWAEDSQNDWFRSTQRSTEGVYSAEVDGSANNATLTMADAIDLTPYSGAELSFSWYLESSFDKNEYLAVDIFNGTWREVARLRGNVDQENVWHHETIAISGADLVNNFKIRFRAKASDSTEDANVDNVLLVPTGLAGPPNQLPTADAGGPYASNEGEVITLSAAGSFDHEGAIVHYEWDLDNDGQFDDASGVAPAFVSTNDGVHQVHLRVTDNRGGTATATTTITVANVGPTASAGDHSTMNEGDVITLSAASSTDPGQDIVSYDWDLDGDGQYDDAHGISPSFSTTHDGVYTVGVRVTDDRGAFSIDTAVVTVANVAPTARAGGPYSGFVGESVLLSAAGSTDPGNDIASYAWDLDGDGQYDDATGANVVLQSSIPNLYTVSVRVTDDDGASSTAATTVNISEVPSEVVVFADSFEHGQWNGRWVEDSQNDWETSTQRKTDGIYSAEVDGSASNATLTLSSPLDLSGYNSAELTFDWLIESGFGRGEYLALDVFNGSSWINDVRRLSGNQSAENVWHHEAVDLSPWMSSSTRIRFRATASKASKDANVDNVRIVAWGAHAAPLEAAALTGAASSLYEVSNHAVHDSYLESLPHSDEGARSALTVEDPLDPAADGTSSPSVTGEGQSRAGGRGRNLP